MKTASPSYYEVLTAAVREFAEAGYVSDLQLERWVRELRLAAERDLIPADTLVAEVRRTLGDEFSRLIDKGGILKHHPGVDRFTLARVRPQLRDELSRRIMASAGLIRLHRETAIAETLRRFTGWATSVPPGGSEAVARNPVKADIRKSLARTPYEYRRCAIDQGHRLAANINAIVAQGSGAIAAKWHRHHTRYPRETHIQRDGKVYLIRNSWAQEKGLVKPGKVGYTDEITQPAEEINCRCTYEYYTSLRQLPQDMLTNKGKEALLSARERIGAAR